MFFKHYIVVFFILFCNLQSGKTSCNDLAPSFNDTESLDRQIVAPPLPDDKDIQNVQEQLNHLKKMSQAILSEALKPKKSCMMHSCDENFSTELAQCKQKYQKLKQDVKTLIAIMDAIEAECYVAHAQENWVIM